MGTMFVILPAFWMRAMGWAGYRAGNALNTISVQGSSKAGEAGNKGGAIITKGGQGTVNGMSKS